MHDVIKSYKEVISAIEHRLKDQNITTQPKVIAVSKTFSLDKILPLIDYGHLDYGENKVQEAIEKWTNIKLTKKDLKLHLIGKLQTNKVKQAIKIFDYIHSVDSEKLAKKIADEEDKQGKKIKIFIQVNIGDEDQKSGINKNQLSDFYQFCKTLKLNVVGLMCIPPFDQDSKKYFEEMSVLNKKLNLNDLSMGMSSDYLEAINYSATYLRIGSSIFGNRN
ncbi:YggS family pyridoxal phosphate-dependent enzyme [Pelagibacterales bacterium SAG-MED02]|jgi:pyridoxal phosphate enzyme (YggS family)|nr:YggS family pyridoxal phosphate-dependent enzyme [Pelagibacterales bacterium SAG-MED02]